MYISSKKWVSYRNEEKYNLTFTNETILAIDILILTTWQIALIQTISDAICI